MFIVKRNSKRFSKLTFVTYDEARQYIRKWIRKNHPEWILTYASTATNPNIGDFNFTISRK